MERHRFEDITAFVSAVKAGSFTAAADSLELTRSAVGKSIARLEAQLSVRLLNRTTRKLSLTDEGTHAYRRWSQILEELEEVDANLALRRGKPSGTLKLLAPPFFGRQHILPVLDDYLKQWPELHAEVWFTDRLVDLIEEALDIAVRIGVPKDDSRMATRTIAWQQFMVCASPSYLARRGIPQTPQELIDHDTIVYFTTGGPRAWRFQTPDGPQLHDSQGRLKMDDYEAIKESMLEGFGLAYVANYIVGDALRAGTLVEVLRTYRPPPDPIRLVYPSRRHLSPRTRGFIDLLVRKWEAGLPWE